MDFPAIVMQFKIDSFAKLLGPELAEKLDIEDVEEEPGEIMNPGGGAAKSEKPQPKVIDDDIEDIEEMKESELIAIQAAATGSTLSEFENMNISSNNG
jgi:hypothetical protein